jgi:hypothetical protein
MTIRIDRKWKKAEYTISKVYINGRYFGCNALEDTDRGLLQTMQITELQRKKIKGKTAIPRGYYDVRITYSPKYKRNMPLVVDVPAFSGIRLHSLNKPEDSEGCIGFGKNDKVGWISDSKYWTDKICRLIEAALNKGEKVTLIVG